MKRRSLSHLADHALIQFLVEALKRENEDSAVVIAAMAEVDERKLYLPAGYPSMFKYCVHKLHMSDDSALKRIRVARMIRQFPVILEALAEGRLNLSAALLLRPRLSTDNVDKLLGLATHKTRVEIELLLAGQFPQPDVATTIVEVAPGPVGSSDLQLAPGPVGETDAQRADAPDLQLSARTVQLAPGPVEAPKPRAKLAPLSPGRFALQVTVDQETHDQLRYAQSLLGHAVPSGRGDGAQARAGRAGA